MALSDRFSKGIVVTSSFSGLGTAELALMAIFRGLTVKLGGRIPPPAFFCACDINKVCQEMLAQAERNVQICRRLLQSHLEPGHGMDGE